jgi:hypothetical protein
MKHKTHLNHYYDSLQKKASKESRVLSSQTDYFHEIIDFLFAFAFAKRPLFSASLRPLALSLSQLPSLIKCLITNSI